MEPSLLSRWSALNRDHWPSVTLWIIALGYWAGLFKYFQPMSSDRFELSDHLHMVCFVFALSFAPLLAASLIKRRAHRSWVEPLMLLAGFAAGTALPILVLFPMRSSGVDFLGFELVGRETRFNYWGETMILQQLPVIGGAQVLLWTAAAFLRKWI